MIRDPNEGKPFIIQKVNVSADQKELTVEQLRQLMTNAMRSAAQRAAREAMRRGHVGGTVTGRLFTSRPEPQELPRDAAGDRWDHSGAVHIKGFRRPLTEEEMRLEHEAVTPVRPDPYDYRFDDAIDAAQKAISPEDRRRYLQDNFQLEMTPGSMANEPHGPRFEVTWSPGSHCWAITGPRGFYLAVRDETLAEGIRALLEGRDASARSFVQTYLKDRGLIP